MTKKPLFEIIVSTMTLAVAFAALLQLPFGGIDAYDDRVTPIMFTTMGALAVASALIIRHQFLRARKQPSEDTFYKGFFYWALPLAVYVLMLPWIFAGILNADDMNTFGALGMTLLLTAIAVLVGILAVGIFWAPFEITVRGIYKTLATRGKDGTGQLIMGLYLLLWLAVIVVGYFSATTDRVSYYGQAQIMNALLGLPGDYTIHDPGLLWVTRGLFALAVVLPFVFEWYKKRNPESPLINNIDKNIP